jgi:hypothetical protein
MSTMSLWQAGGIATGTLLGAVALTLWRRRPGDGRDDWGRGAPDRPQLPTGSSGEDLHWSLFEAEYWEYVRADELRRELGIRAS